MSVLGLGTDIVAVERISQVLDRHGERFLARCFQQDERERIKSRTGSDQAAMAAGRWAAKEAFLKALGGAIAHIPYQDISVIRQAGGAPRLEVSGLAAEELAKRGGQRLHLSISHERRYAVATVLIED